MSLLSKKRLFLSPRLFLPEMKNKKLNRSDLAEIFRRSIPDLRSVFRRSPESAVKCDFLRPNAIKNFPLIN